MKLHRIQALLYRHTYPLRRDFDLLSDMIYWPMVDTVLWGVTSQWLSDSAGGTSIVASILLGLVLWNIIWRSQAEVSRNLMDEIWNNNLVNLFSTPLTVPEWVSSVLILSIVKTSITLSLLIPVVFLLYSVNVFALGLWLPVLFLGATMTGWWLGFISAGIVLRYGPKVQTVIWTLPGILLPFSAIFFPLERLPIFLQPISRAIPTTYVLETMRSILAGTGVSGEYMVLALGLNTLYVLGSLYFFYRSFLYSANLGLGRFN
ncbi:MAG: ABC transporter permease [Microgenomates group bacterium]